MKKGNKERDERDVEGRWMRCDDCLASRQNSCSLQKA